MFFFKDFDTVPYGTYVAQSIINPTAAISSSRIFVANSKILTTGYMTGIELYAVAAGIITVYVSIYLLKYLILNLYILRIKVNLRLLFYSYKFNL